MGKKSNKKKIKKVNIVKPKKGTKVMKKKNDVGKKRLGKKEEIDALVKSDQIISRLKSDLSLSGSKYKSLLKQIKSLESAHFMLVESRGGKKLRIPKATSSRGSKEVTPVVVLSDWHIDELVKPESINFMNEYNPEIAQKRVTKLFQGIVRFVDIWKRDSKINTMVVALLGDFISGYIHEELMESNTTAPPQSIRLARKLLEAGIQFILDNTDLKKLVIPCCHGNHGRGYGKRKVSTAPENSLERAMYLDMEDKFNDKKEKRVEFHVSDGYHQYLDVYGMRLRFHHGDWMRYLGGVGGITIPVMKAIHQWNQSRPADIDVFGHFHTYMNVGPFVANGSTIGYNSFAESIKARMELPSQAMFLLDPRRGKTVGAPIVVESRKIIK